MTPADNRFTRCKRLLVLGLELEFLRTDVYYLFEKFKLLSKTFSGSAFALRAPLQRTSPIHPIRRFSHLVAPEPPLRFVTNTAGCRRSHRELSITAAEHCFYAVHTRQQDEIAQTH